MTKLIVGLGNPGDKYEKTRHNVGFMAIEYFLHEQGFTWKKIENQGRYSLLNIAGNRFIALEPLTFMNDSGKAVKYIRDKYEIKFENILVVRDDMDLPTGKIRIKKDRSAGGHNGVKDIMKSLESKDFINLKVGINHPLRENVINWVLGKFSKSEMMEINPAIVTSSEIILKFIEGMSAEMLMNEYN